MGGFLDQLGSAIGGALPTVAGYAIGGVPGAIIGSSISGGMGVAQTNSANQAIMQQNNDFNAQQADYQRLWSAEQAQKQMNFQEEMSNTQWQRGVKDMEAAGLSPMLAYMKGGASAPSGAMGSSSAASASSNIPMQSVPGGVLSGMQSAVQMANLIVDTENKKATTGLIGAQTELASSSASLNAAQIDQVNAAVDKIRAEIPKIQGDTNFEEQQSILRNTARLIFQQGTASNMQSLNLEQQNAVIRETVKKVVSETDLNKLDIDAARTLNNLGRDAGQLKPIVEMILNAVRLFKSR